VQRCCTQQARIKPLTLNGLDEGVGGQPAAAACSCGVGRRLSVTGELKMDTTGWDTQWHQEWRRRRRQRQRHKPCTALQLRATSLVYCDSVVPCGATGMPLRGVARRADAMRAGQEDLSKVGSSKG